MNAMTPFKQQQQPSPSPSFFHREGDKELRKLERGREVEDEVDVGKRRAGDNPIKYKLVLKRLN